MKKPEGRGIFLDRDGTIIYDVGYPRDPEQVRLLPGVGEALERLRKSGFALVLVSNQAGIGRGLITSEEAARVHDTVVASLAEYGVELDGAYYCPHRPEEECSCRKPSPDLLLRAAEELNLNLALSFLIGDKASDIEAGRRAGCRTIFLASSGEPAECEQAPTYIATSWPEVVRYILRLNQHS